MKKIIIVTLLLIISAILLGDMEIKHYDTKDMISIIIKDRKLINERRKNANLDSLEIDTSNITDSLLYNYLVSTLFNENKIDYNTLPKVLNSYLFRDRFRSKFIYKDILIYNSNGFMWESETNTLIRDTLSINDLFKCKDINAINYFYIFSYHRVSLNNRTISSLGGNWKFSRIDSLIIDHDDVGAINYLKEYHPDNFQETKFGSETINRIIKFYPAKITFDNVNYHVDESISKEKFALGRNLENVNFAERVIYRYLGNIDLEIINSDLNNVILGDLCTQIIIKNSVIENLEIFGRKDNILILEENTLKNLTINRPNNLILKSNNIEKKFNLQPSLNDSINNNITLEDNEFQEGINFDWDVLKTMNLNVSEGPNKAERMISMYSTLKKSLRRRNRLDDVDDCHYASHDYLRKNYWKDSDAGFLNRIFKTLFYYVDWISTGYGTQPLRIFPYALVVIFVFAFVYFLKPDYISNLHEHIEFENIIKNKLSILTMDELRFKFKIVEGEDEQLDKMKMIEKIIFELPRLEIIKVAKLKFIKNKIILFGNCFYFSFCTFTTIGVGDWYPRNILSKCLVMIEGALGWISLGLFITSYGNLLLR